MMKTPQIIHSSLLLGVGYLDLADAINNIGWNSACGEWLKWHEELRLALGAQPGDDLIEYAKEKPRDVVFTRILSLLKERDMEIENLRDALSGRDDILEEKDQEIEELKERLYCQSDAIRMNDIGIARRDNDIQELKRRVNEQSHAISVLNDSLAQKDKDIEGWQKVVNRRGEWIDDLNAKIAEKEDMLDTAAKLIKLQRDAMALLLESVKTEKGEPNES